MIGKFIAAVIVVSGIIAGAALYYLQVYAYYDRIVPNGSNDVVLTLRQNATAQPIDYNNFKAIDSNSSPIRYRACFTTTAPIDALKNDYVIIKDAEPLVAPRWFECFDAKEIGAAIEEQQATSFMSIENVTYGVDRVVTVLPDGRGFAWNRINRCGKVVFAGKPVPPNCPKPPESN